MKRTLVEVDIQNSYIAVMFHDQIKKTFSVCSVTYL